MAFRAIAASVLASCRRCRLNIARYALADQRYNLLNTHTTLTRILMTESGLNVFLLRRQCRPLVMAVVFSGGVKDFKVVKAGRRGWCGRWRGVK